MYGITANQMDSIEKVNEVCKLALSLTDEDLKAVDEMSNEQAGYLHPFNGEKQAKFNDLGNHNQKVLDAVKNLREILIDGAPN